MGVVSPILLSFNTTLPASSCITMTTRHLKKKKMMIYETISVMDLLLMQFSSLCKFNVKLY